ncbi:hypothetical protein DFP72DRAFT_529526 [Ephemerocybe angulata]|uniref:Uncharacterized protein n=1 Tax=Ephemerocybe angulata TaxID=980116 RepID=A0A8H6IFF9_9AGAR|nr:hypothetical protein DFP72DRAFT_529526 [Tulosesus angulatus]
MLSSFNGPDLPTELWNQILPLAAGANNSIEFRGIDDTGPMCCSSCTFPVFKPGTVRKSLKTKRSMVLVNHEWNTIATPILYEHLTISRGVELKKLSATLTSEDDDGLSLGRFVKRLDLTNNAADRIPIGVAIELCQKMVNLVTFFVRLEGNINPVPLLAALGPQLRQLEIQVHNERVASSMSFDNLLEFLNGHPNLTSISFPFVITGLDEASHELLAKNSKTRRWPSIHKWTFQHPTQTSALALHVSPGAFPSLTEIGFDQCAHALFRCQWSEDMKGFLVAHGGSLLSIGLWLRGEHRGLCELSRSFQRNSDFCPRTNGVDISIITHGERGIVTGWTAWFDQVCRMPQITTLGVRLCSPRHGDERIVCIHYAVALPWPKIFPKLERIRVLLVEELDIDRYRIHDDVTRKYLTSPARWATRPIRVEDVSGTILGEQSKGLCTLVER